jgi:hypothetical protein
MMSNKTKAVQFKWLHKLVKKSRTPWANDSPDALRICWFFDEKTKQAIYEYRNDKGGTNGFAITSRLQEQLPEHMNQKYFSKDERALVFGYFFTEISEFINKHVDESDFFNFTGVTKETFFSTESYESLLLLCEQSIE